MSNWNTCDCGREKHRNWETCDLCKYGDGKAPKQNSGHPAYVGKFSIRDIHTKRLIRGGGVVAPRPRLYDSEAAATEAARAIRWADVEVVELT